MALNRLNAELNPICHLLALLGAHHIFHASGLRVNTEMDIISIVVNLFLSHNSDSIIIISILKFFFYWLALKAYCFAFLYPKVLLLLEL
jgi:hypothetical protein